MKAKNARSLRVYNNCDNLPAWRFFKVIKTGDLRYLVEARELPEYFEHLLEPVWDEIVVQFDKLNGEYTFQNAIEDIKDDIFKMNQYIILKAAYGLMLLGDVRALQVLEENFGIIIKDITVDNIKKIRSKVLQTQTQLQIERLARKEVSEEKDPNKEDNDYIKSIIQMSGILKRNLNKDRITVTEWIYLNRECTDIIKIYKEHGRRNKA